MDSRTNNSFEYFDDLSNDGCNNIPDGLKLCSCSLEALTLRLLLGHIRLKLLYESKIVKQNRNYSILPYRNIRKLNYKIFNNAMGIENLQEEETKRICNKYFLHNRRNSYVHERILNEISWYFLKEKVSPMESFVHLYRCLEFASYSFPMIYASTARDYKGTYENLKKFIGGTDTGELKFFRNFLNSLFESEGYILEYTFKIPVSSPNLDELRNEVNEIFNSAKLYFEFDDSMLCIKFKDIISAFIQVRNRYFHMLVGSGQRNVDSIRYDINDLFEALNPHLLNWLAIIFVKIVQHGYELAVLYS